MCMYVCTKFQINLKAQLLCLFFSIGDITAIATVMPQKTFFCGRRAGMSRVNEMTFFHYQFNDLNCSGGVCLCSESFSLRKKKIKRWREIGVLCIAFNSSDFRIFPIEPFVFFFAFLFLNSVSYEHHYKLLKTICML